MFKNIYEALTHNFRKRIATKENTIFAGLNIVSNILSIACMDGINILIGFKDVRKYPHFVYFDECRTLYHRHWNEFMQQIIEYKFVILITFVWYFADLRILHTQ